MKVEINHRKRNEKKPTTWRLNNMLLESLQFNDKIKERVKKYEKNDNENTTINLQDAAKAVLSKTSLPQKTRQTSNTP